MGLVILQHITSVCKSCDQLCIFSFCESAIVHSAVISLQFIWVRATKTQPIVTLATEFCFLYAICKLSFKQVVLHAEQPLQINNNI